MYAFSLSLVTYKLESALGFCYLVIMFCVVRYECEESFTTLNVDIRNHQNLLDSMEQYVKGDLLEGANAYHCEKCNKKVRMEHPSGTQPVLECDTHKVLWKNTGGINGCPMVLKYLFSFSH